MKKTIYSFMRLTETGFEKVTWKREADGTKSVSRHPVKPSPEELKQLAVSKYNEIILTT